MSNENFPIYTVPDLPILKRLCTVVIWKPSPNPAGKIVGYELRFEGMKGEIMNFSADDNFHLTSDNQRLRNVDVQVSTCNPGNCCSGNKCFIIMGFYYHFMSVGSQGRVYLIV